MVSNAQIILKNILFEIDRKGERLIQVLNRKNIIYFKDMKFIPYLSYTFVFDPISYKLIGKEDDKTGKGFNILIPKDFLLHAHLYSSEEIEKHNKLSIQHSAGFILVNHHILNQDLEKTEKSRSMRLRRKGIS